MVNIIFQTPDGAEVEAEMQEGETVLQTAQRIQLDIAHICLRGDCGQCQCDSHALDTPDQNEEIRTCKTRPTVDIKVFTEGVGNRRYREFFGRRE